MWGDVRFFYKRLMKDIIYAHKTYLSWRVRLCQSSALSQRTPEYLDRVDFGGFGKKIRMDRFHNLSSEKKGSKCCPYPYTWELSDRHRRIWRLQNRAGPRSSSSLCRARGSCTTWDWFWLRNAELRDPISCYSLHRHSPSWIETIAENRSGDVKPDILNS